MVEMQAEMHTCQVYSIFIQFQPWLELTPIYLQFEKSV